MSFQVSKILTIITIVLYIIALFSIVLTSEFTAYENLLRNISKENGFFESVSVFLLLIIVFIGIKTLIQEKNIFEKWIFIGIAVLTILAFLAAMEEISWGQHLFDFESSDYFKTQNLQGETNLHNLMNANLFSSILYASIYILLVFIPLFVKLKSSLKERFVLSSYFDISPHTILVLLFASVFQIYFYDDFGVWFDMFAHLSALLLFGMYVFMTCSTLWLKLHYAFIVSATCISMLSYEIYRFENMQYEIRETFVVLAVLLILMELIWQEKKKAKKLNEKEVNSPK